MRSVFFCHSVYLRFELLLLLLLLLVLIIYFFFTLFRKYRAGETREMRGKGKYNEKLGRYQAKSRNTECQQTCNYVNVVIPLERGGILTKYTLQMNSSLSRKSLEDIRSQRKCC